MLNIGDKVLSTEHPKAIGTVTRQTPIGYVIEFETAPHEHLPYGHIITEVWPFDDAETLILATEGGR